MGTVAPHFCASQNDLKPEMLLNLAPHLLEQIAKKLLDFAATQADNVRVLLFQAGLVVVLVALVVHQVQLVHQAAGLEQLERSIDRHAIQLGILFAAQLKQPLSLEVLARLIDQVEQDLTLTRKPYAALSERILDAGDHHGAVTFLKVSRLGGRGSKIVETQVGDELDPRN
jgi:hypothetical protein